jgi:hypothetical protein
MEEVRSSVTHGIRESEKTKKRKTSQAEEWA